jgi:hypothetical protein
MEPNWYYTDDGDQQCFVVYDDLKGSCKRRRFVAQHGAFVDETPAYPGDFAQHFRSEIKLAQRLGGLRGRPNLVDAVKARKLPGDVLAELKELLRNIHGTQI